MQYAFIVGRRTLFEEKNDDRQYVTLSIKKVLDYYAIIFMLLISEGSLMVSWGRALLWGIFHILKGITLFILGNISVGILFNKFA